MQLKVYMKKQRGEKPLKKNYRSVLRAITSFAYRLRDDDISAFAASSAYFFILSFIPLVMLLMSLLHYTDLSKEQLISLTTGLIPAEMSGFFSDIVDEVYGKTAAAASISAVVTLWTSGKGFMALRTGMHAVIKAEDRKNYFFMRLTGVFYAIAFLVLITMALALGVFGQRIEDAIGQRIDVSVDFWDIVVSFRKFIMLAVFICIFFLSYRFIPDWKQYVKSAGYRPGIIDMLPGAAVSAVGWHLYSALFSLYLRYSHGLENMYGSLAALIGIMLWLYGCMYLVLAGLEINMCFIRVRKKTVPKEKKR